MKRLILVGAILMGTIGAFNAQSNGCTDLGAGPYTNFNTSFGGAPTCLPAGETVAVNTITAFDIWSSDSYLLDNIMVGETYEFGAVDNVAFAESAWFIYYIVLDQTGAIVAEGQATVGFVDDHSIQWTATSSGTYTVIIREDGECSAPFANDLVDNGAPYIANLTTQASCVPCDDSNCEAGVFVDDSAVDLCPGEDAIADASGVVIPDGTCAGEVTVTFEQGADGTGGLGEDYFVSGITLPYTFDDDLEGLLSSNGFPPMRGAWNVGVSVRSEGVVCDTTFRKKPCYFYETGVGPCAPSVCVAGDVFLGDQSVCPGESVDFTLTEDHILPNPGAFYWYFENVNDTTDFRLVNFGNDPTFYQYMGDLNGLFAFNGIDTLSPGLWFFFGGNVDMTDTTFCDFTGTWILEILDTSDPLCGGTDCSVFDTAPVDLTKSFDPVNGVRDRVQVKWFKDTPQVKYSDADAAACDIKFWPKRNLDPVTGDPFGDPIVAAPGDTTLIVDAKKYQADGVTPREIFKWPVKFRKNSDNPGAKRADPNIRYEWQVRCACDFGAGPESPWSVVKIFNVPDFDPETGIYTPPGGAVPDHMATKSKKIPTIGLADKKLIDRLNTRKSQLQGDLRVKGKSKRPVLTKGMTESKVGLYPNPAYNVLNIVADTELSTVVLKDLEGRVVLRGTDIGTGQRIDISSLNNGMYMVEFEIDGMIERRPFMVKH